MSHTLVGILARVDRESNPDLREELCRLDGVSTFEVGDDCKIGILLYATNTDDAHRKLRHEIETTSGVLAAWPVYTHYGEEFMV